MKLKNIIIALLAILPLASSCVKEELGTLSDIQVSKTFVTLPLDGGSDAITLNTKGDWTMDIKWPVIKEKDKEVENKWFTVNQLSGSAATDLELTFSAEKVTSFRSLDIKIVCNGQTQLIKVAQGKDVPAPATVKEILSEDSPVGKTFLVTGTVVSIDNTEYGNWYLQDESTEELLYIYGTLDKNGQPKNFKSLNIAVGDLITIKGPKDKYKGNPQLVDVTMLKLKKALVGVNKTEETLEQNGKTADGKDIELLVARKGNTLKFECSEWISLKNIEVGANETQDSTLYTFAAQPFDEQTSPRSGFIKFVSTLKDDKSEVNVKISQYGITPDPIKIAEAVTNEKDTWLSVQGTIVGTHDKGSILSDGKDQIYIYENAKSTVKVGDNVLVTGALGNYNGFYQIAKPVIRNQGKGTAKNPKATVVTKEYIDSFVGKTSTSKFVTITGKPNKEDHDGLSVSVGDYKVNSYWTPSSFNLPSFYDVPEIVLEGFTVQVRHQDKNNDQSPYELLLVVTSVKLPAFWEESFQSGIGEFTVVDNVRPEENKSAWNFNDGKHGTYMQASGHIGESNFPSEGLLVSPEIDLTGKTKVTLNFEHVGNFFNDSDTMKANATLWVKKAGADYKQVSIKNYSGKSWDWINSGDIDLSEFAGGKIQIAFKYTSTEEVAGTWRIKNVALR